MKGLFIFVYLDLYPTFKLKSAQGGEQQNGTELKW